MMDCAAKMQYERAAALRDKIRDVEGLMERQIAIQTDRSEQDIIALAQDGLDAMVHIFYVRGGRMVGGDHFALPREGSEEPGDVLASFITQYYEDGNLIPRHVLVQSLPDGALTRNVVLFAVLIYELVGPALTKRSLLAVGEIVPFLIAQFLCKAGHIVYTFGKGYLCAEPAVFPCFPPGISGMNRLKIRCRRL